jgi:hypothetical protein
MAVPAATVVGRPPGYASGERNEGLDVVWCTVQGLHKVLWSLAKTTRSAPCMTCAPAPTGFKGLDAASLGALVLEGGP